MVMTLSGKTKDYSFVTDGERRGHTTHTLSHTQTQAHNQANTHTRRLPRGGCDLSDSYIVLAVTDIPDTPPVP